MNTGFRRAYQVNNYSQLTPNQKSEFNAAVAELRNKLPPGFTYLANFNSHINKGNLYNAARLLFPTLNRNTRNKLINKVLKYKKPIPRANAHPTVWKNGANANAILRNALDKGRISEILNPYFLPAIRYDPKVKKIWGVSAAYFKNALNAANHKNALVGTTNGHLYGLALTKNRNQGRYLDVLGAMPGYGPKTMQKVISNAQRNGLLYVSLKAVVSNPTITKKRVRGKNQVIKSSVGNKLTNWYTSPAGGEFIRRGNFKGSLQPMVRYLTQNMAQRNQVNRILEKQNANNAAANAKAAAAARAKSAAARAAAAAAAPPPTRTLRPRRP